MMNRLFVFLALAILMMACGQSWKEDSGGITVYPTNPTDGGAKVIHVQPVSDQTFEVRASAASELSENESLIKVPSEGVKFKAVEENGLVVIKTAKAAAKINATTGEVSFFDEDGNLIMKEDAGKRIFKKINVEGTDGYEMSQVFDSPKDEALYGLGQHQADEMNYKGKNEELFQYNTKVSIPFVVSTKNYGVLWDNYSLTRFGDPRPYSNINTLKLYDKDGKEGGLTATYIDDLKTGHEFLVRTESTIDYENLTTIKKFPEGFNFQHAKITWEGSIEGDEKGVYNFLCYYAGYTKLWVDGELQFDKWRTAWNPSVAKFHVAMEKGVKKHIKLEWLPDGGVSYIGLKTLSPRNEEAKNDLSFFSEMGQEIRYYMMTGTSMDDVISQYRTVTGKAQVMPKWSMGFWQSRERYKTQDELLDVLAEFRKRHIPLDNIVVDWSYWPQTAWGSHDFDKARFPDAKAMNDQIHEQNAHVMISVWPKFYHNTEHYKQFDEKGWMYTRAVEDSVRDWIGQGYIGSFYDAYSEGARKLFWDQIHDKLYTKGFDAWWMDASEPDILSNASIEYRKELMTPTALGPSTEYFNAYALMNAKGIYEGQRQVDNDKRVFILTRSGFAGLQRYGAVTWSGDIGTVWEDMKAQISAGINFAMSGLPYWTMDVGGFCVEKRYEVAKEGSEDMEEWRELNTRWYQFGAFVPLFRVHGQYPFREVWNIAPEKHQAYKSMLYYNKLRYRLMPYIYTLAGMTHFDDYTMMRGLAMDFTDDKNVYNIGDQYMFGPSLMVCPVYEYKARSREVYLPKTAGWYDAYTGSWLDAGVKMTADAPYEKMPMYVKAGSILPMGPEIEYTTQKPADKITLVVYTGADASFELYEDEGTNYNYEKGKYAVIPFSYSEADKTLTIGARKGEFEGMLKDRQFNVVFVSKDKAMGIDDAQTATGQVENYNGEALTIKMQ
nr:TIM-barrel domain-containing protein [uncultured Carboxylicivirga sp.]